MVKEIKNIEDFVEAIGNEKNGLVVVDFYTTWCGPCQMIAPFMVELSKKYPSVSFNKINYDDPEVTIIARKCEIKSFPTFCFFNGGQYIDSVKGANKQLLENKIIQYLTVNPQANPVEELPKNNSEQ